MSAPRALVASLPVPPSANRWLKPASSGQMRLVKSPEHKRWAVEAGWELRAQRGDVRARPLPGGPVEVYIEADVHDQRDIDNIAKPTLDLLVAHEILRDDNARIVRRLTLVVAGRDLTPAGKPPGRWMRVRVSDLAGGIEIARRTRR